MGVTDRVTLPLLLEDGQPIDHATQPPKGCQGDLEQMRPCPRTACRYHLWPQDERPGRPHSPGARPPVTLRREGPSCMFDEIKTQPDGLTADDVGEAFGTCGERIRQVEHRGALKWEGVEFLKTVLEAARERMPPGTAIEHVLPHNDHQLPNQHFVTVVLRVDAKQDTRVRPAFSGVMVRKKRK